jgi:hypothetical protein
MKTKALRKDAPHVVQVIYTETERRGSGMSIHDPVRSVRQVFDLDGNLIMEHDPYAMLTVREVMEVIKHRDRSEDARPLEDLLTDLVKNKNHKPF